MKTKEELKALKEEVETLNKKLAELTDEELAQVTGGKGAGEGDHVASKQGWFCAVCNEVTTSNEEAAANGYHCKVCNYKFNTGIF